MKALTTLLTILILCIELQAQQRPEQDCIGAVRICDNVNFTVPVTYNGFGNIKDIPDNTTCLTNEENNSSWFFFEADSAGTVVFTIDPLQPDDYDFAVFKANSCNEISNDTAPAVRCSYSGLLGPTGLRVGDSLTIAGLPDPTFLAPLEVLAGEKYYLVIDNFNTGGAGYHLDFTGTTAKFKSDSATVLVYDQFLGYTSVYPENIRLRFNGYFNCSGASIDKADYQITGPTSIIIDSIAFVCNSNNSSAIDVFYTGTFLDNETYQIEISPSARLVPLGNTYSCVQTAVAFDSIYSFVANVIPIDTFIFDIDSIVESRSSSYFSYNIYTVPESPFIFTFSDNDYTLDTLNKKIRFTSSGTKEVCAIAYNQLYADTICKTINVFTSISEFDLQQSFSVFPNPATNKIFVEALGNEKIEQISIYDILGKTVVADIQKINANHFIISIARFTSGLYYVQIVTENNKSIIKKVAVYTSGELN